MFLKVAIVVLSCFSVNGQGNIGNKSTMAYDAGELLSKIFSGNVTQPRRLIKFDNQLDSNYVSFDDQNIKLPDATPFKFEKDQGTYNPSTDSYDDRGPMQFNDFGQDIAANGLNIPIGNESQPGNGKKRRRRRKQRQQFQGKRGFWNLGYPGVNGPVLAPGQRFGSRPGLSQSIRPYPEPDQNFGPAAGPGQYFGPNGFPPDFSGQFYRPSRRPQPSLASNALTAVTEALISIAHNDDYQCVARLLCEAAAGGALSGSSLLESISGLQPLITLLSAYNGISSNPLFVFGRATFLGISSKGKPGSCRYAYPLCPTDPEQLVHYLNNHNGGFFRFFNAPHHGQQNIEQFYNQLSQNYGLHQPSVGNNQEFYGLSNPGPYQNPAGQANLYSNGYSNYQQNYGFAYPYNQNYNSNGIRFKNYNEGSEVNNGNDDENKIEKRIQNKPANYLNYNSDVSNSKWLFPDEDDDVWEDNDIGVQYINNDDFGFTDNKNGKTLKFPDAQSTYDNNYIQEFNRNPTNIYTTETIRKPKGITFPENQRNINDYNANIYYSSMNSNGINYHFNNANEGSNGIFKGMGYNQNDYNDYQDEGGVTTVYVVRGNGDPNRPEIVKLRPGETLK